MFGWWVSKETQKATETEKLKRATEKVGFLDPFARGATMCSNCGWNEEQCKASSKVSERSER